MRILCRLVLIATLFAPTGCGNSEVHVAVKPEVGLQAPSFELQGSDGKTYRLEDFHGRSAVVVAWFPKAFTGG